MNETNKKKFDPTVCFSFFGSWYTTIETIKQDDAEKAYQLFQAIAEYSLYDIEPNFGGDIFMKAIWATLEKEIDISIGKRKRGFAKDESDKIYQSVLTALVKYPDKSLREIAEMTGSNKDTVNRLKKRYKSQIDKAIEEGKDLDFVNGTVNDTDTDFVNGTVNDTVNDNDNDNDSIRQDRDKTERQMCLLDKIRNTIIENPSIVIDIDNTTPESLYCKSKWSALYSYWLSSISNTSVDAILKKYLSTHKETATLKRYGDKYGRIIDGYDLDKQEPIIVYSVTGYFPQGTRHNITDIPITYYMSTGDIAAMKEEEEMLLEYIEEESESMLANDTDMPF